MIGEMGAMTAVAMGIACTWKSLRAPGNHIMPSNGFYFFLFFLIFPHFLNLFYPFLLPPL